MLVVVLNDGETYTDIGGCVVLEVPDEIKDVDLYVKKNLHEGIDVLDILQVYDAVGGHGG